MANLYYDVRVDIQRDTVIDSGIRLTQGDSKVIYLRIVVMNGSSVFDDSNTTPSICFVKPDGRYVVGTPVKSDNYWIYQILGNEIQAAGKVLCDMKFTYASGRVSSSKFTINVERDTTISNAEASTSYIAPMESLLGSMENYRNQGYSMATAAQSWAAGGTGTRPGEDSDNAKYYYEHARAVSNVDIATTTQAGLVKPDGNTIKINTTDGTITAESFYTRANFVMLGDSNAKGYDLVDGVFAVLRDKYPNATFTNLAIGGATWTGQVNGQAYTSNLYAQAQNITGTPDVIFVWAGGNDISLYSTSHQSSLGEPKFNSFDENDFDLSTTYNGCNKTLLYLRKTYPNAKIVGVVRTYKDSQRLNLQTSIYGMLVALYKKYNCGVINLNDYSSICDAVSAQKTKYFMPDGVHYNEDAFRELIEPVFEGVIESGMNTTTDIKISNICIDEENVASKTLSELIVIAKKYSSYYSIISGQIEISSPSGNYALLDIAKSMYSADVQQSTALRFRTANDKIDYVRYNGTNTFESTLMQRFQGKTNLDVLSCVEGDYVITNTERSTWTNIPDDITYGGLLMVRDNANDFRYAIIYGLNGKVMYGMGSKSGTSLSWVTIV